MRAIVHSEFGSPDVLRLADIEKPAPNERQVLIKVHAASVNPLDWHFVRGEPAMLRMMGKPKNRIPGVDVAGRVETVGAKVSSFRAGDEVFGTCKGAFAQYACLREDRCLRKPPGLSFEEAAALPVVTFTAVQALRDKGRLQPGQSVLVNGASGGVGTFAVQIAKALGGIVTGVCSTRNLDLLRSLGAAHVIDYTKEDFTRSEQRYDLILHIAGIRTVAELKRALAPDGTIVFVGGGTGRDVNDSGGMLEVLDILIRGNLLSRFTRQRVLMLLARGRTSDLVFVLDLIEDGKLKPVIERTYPLEDAAAGLRDIEAGHARGKVIIVV
jgi:NADPH:quinone reductase-like Zn-dependent oxidoreductase